MQRSADLVLVAGVVHSFGAGDRPARAVAIGDGVVLGVGGGLDDLRPWLGPQTRVVDDPELVVLPGFFDTHNHLLSTSEDELNVDVSSAPDIDGIVAALRERAATTPAGEWIKAARGWHESTIGERRLPTAAELDAATPDHPVFLPRGGHVGVANTMAMTMAGLADRAEDPAGGTLVRDDDGRPTGVLIEYSAMEPVLALLPRSGRAERLAALEATACRYASRGLVAVRDPGIGELDYELYQQLHRDGALPLRVRAMIRLDPALPFKENLELLRSFEVSPGGDDALRLDGIKIFADGGVEGAWMKDAYTNDADYRGHAFIDSVSLEALVDECLGAGWRVGVHALGDLTIPMVLDAFEAVVGRRGPQPPGQLVIEHGFLADETQRRRAVALGVGITVQHPLLYSLAANMLIHWGADRTAAVMPVAGLLEEGVLVAAGSDCNVTPFDPLLSIWGLVTRGTKVSGVQGVENAVDRRTAFALYTSMAAQLVRDETVRGRIAPGMAADLVAFRTDPMTCPIDEIPELDPVLTVVGGKAVHDPGGLI